MDPESDQVGPSKNHQLFYNPNDPDDTMVMLKNIQHMGYYNYSSWIDDGTGKQVYKFFPNYFILNNITIAHKQKKLLHAMLNQETDPQMMIEQFCKLAAACYAYDKMEINKLKKDFLGQSVPASDIIKWYTQQSFFFKLINRLLRAGKDSTEVYYGQHFTKLLTQAIQEIYQKQKAQKRQQVSGTFNCYRGAYFKEEQIAELQQSIGKHIETLGFMSTSIKQKVAFDFLGSGNAFVEIQVCSDTLKDGELDLGYAYCADYSQSPQEGQVLFNVLSSFQIKSVEKFDYQGREVWKIKLKYGVTYQMVHNYKQNKLSKGTAEEQQVLAILSYQNTFKTYNNQEVCLDQQNAVEEYIWLKKTKISLCKSIPLLQWFGQRQQFDLYHRLTTDDRFKGKQQKYVKQIEPKYLSSINQQNSNQSADILMQNMNNISHQILNHYGNDNFESVQQLAKKWRQLKQQILSDIRFQQQAIRNPQTIEGLKQQETQVSVCQAAANIELLDKKGDIQKLKQQIEAAQQLQQQLLTKYDRYHPFYMLLRQCCMCSAYKHGLISFEAWLEFKQQQLMLLNGAEVDQQNTFQSKLVSMQNQINRHIQQKHWAEAVRLCAEFRDKHYKGREHQDKECFRSIISQYNKKNNNLMEKLQILQTFLSVQHPKHSAFYKMAEESWTKCKQVQLKCQKAYMDKLQEVITWPAQQQLTELFRLKKKQGLPAFEPKDSMLWIITECLIANALRMTGRYQRAYKYAEQLKKQYSAAKHFQLFRQCHRQLLN